MTSQCPLPIGLSREVVIIGMTRVLKDRPGIDRQAVRLALYIDAGFSADAINAFDTEAHSRELLRRKLMNRVPVLEVM